MTFSESVKTGLSKFFDPRGRTTRSGYWWYCLFVYVILYPVSVALMFASFAIFSNKDFAVAIGYALIATPFISLMMTGVRRMHDIGMSGWNLLWPSIPYFAFLLTQMNAELTWNDGLVRNFGRFEWNFLSVIFFTAYILTQLYLFYLLCKPSEPGENYWEYTVKVEDNQ